MSKPIAITNPARKILINIRYNIRHSFWKLMNKLGVPGFICPITISDPVTKTWIKIEVTNIYTIITVNGTDYYFYRRNGKYDGWGRGCRDFSQEQLLDSHNKNNVPMICKD